MTNNTIQYDDTNASSTGIDRRNLLKMTGAGVAALGAMSMFDIMEARAQDMSNGASNFYTSDKVTLHKVTFKTQYQTSVAGNLYLPKGLDRGRQKPCYHRRSPDGSGQGTERKLLRHKDGRARFCCHVDRPALLG